jgi:hypothetical protein
VRCVVAVAGCRLAHGRSPACQAGRLLHGDQGRGRLTTAQQQLCARRWQLVAGLADLYRILAVPASVRLSMPSMPSMLLPALPVALCLRTTVKTRPSPARTLTVRLTLNGGSNSHLTRRVTTSSQPAHQSNAVCAWVHPSQPGSGGSHHSMLPPRMVRTRRRRAWRPHSARPCPGTASFSDYGVVRVPARVRSSPGDRRGGVGDGARVGDARRQRADGGDAGCRDDHSPSAVGPEAGSPVCVPLTTHVRATLAVTCCNSQHQVTTPTGGWNTGRRCVSLS